MAWFSALAWRRRTNFLILGSYLSENLPLKGTRPIGYFQSYNGGVLVADGLNVSFWPVSARRDRGLKGMAGVQSCLETLD